MHLAGRMQLQQRMQAPQPPRPALAWRGSLPPTMPGKSQRPVANGRIVSKPGNGYLLNHWRSPYSGRGNSLPQPFRSRFGLCSLTANRTLGPRFREINGRLLFSRRRRARASALKWPRARSQRAINARVAKSQTVGCLKSRIIKVSTRTALSLARSGRKARAAQLTVSRG